jgi:hypothetical protein
LDDTLVQVRELELVTSVFGPAGTKQMIAAAAYANKFLPRRQVIPAGDE